MTQLEGEWSKNEVLRCTLKWINDGKKEHLEEYRVFGMASGGEFHVE